MAAEPAMSAIFRALRSVDVDPDLAYEAAEESRRQAGENVIAVIGAQIAEFRTEMEMRFSELKSENAEMRAEFKAENAEIRSEVKAQGARVDALGSRIDTLQKVIWPLMAILATCVFGLLYKAVTGQAHEKALLHPRSADGSGGLAAGGADPFCRTPLPHWNRRLRHGPPSPP